MKLGFSLIVGLTVMSTLPCHAAATCESLALLLLPNTTITMAQIVPSATFVVPRDFKGSGRCWFEPCPTANEPGDVFKNLPSFCRFSAILKPTSDSEIKIEVWMPSSGWNHKLLALGNGAWAGMITYPGLAVGVSRGVCRHIHEHRA